MQRLCFGLLLALFVPWRASAAGWEVTVRNYAQPLLLVQGEVSYQVGLGVWEVRLPAAAFYLLGTNGQTWGLAPEAVSGTAIELQVGQSLGGLVVAMADNWSLGDVLWLGFKVGCGMMGAGYALQLARSLGKTSPEL